MPTPDECKRLLSKLGFKHGVSPVLISTRLLSIDDKNDMLMGLVSTEQMETAIDCWIKAKLPDYSNGHTEPLKDFYEKVMVR